MSNLISKDLNALRLLMNEEVYLVETANPTPKENEVKLSVEVPQEKKPLLEKADDIEIPNLAVLHPSKSETGFNYLGENNKYFLILVEDPTHTTLNAAHKEMILKIMAAKKIELRDLAILNLSHYPGTTFQQLKDFFSPQRVTLFGINPQQLGIPGVKANTITKINGVQLLATFGLAAMSVQVEKKKEFWNLMKGF